MFLILISMITLASCLEPTIIEDKPDNTNDNNTIDEEIKNIITKYISKIPDVEPQYVIHEGLSKVISRYFKEKITTFPLYKISLRLDRNPVKIPWTLVDPANMSPTNALKNETEKPVRTYKYIKGKDE